MSTFMVRAVQVRKVDGRSMVRRLIVNAGSPDEARADALKHCAGYIQCAPAEVQGCYLVPGVASFDEFSE